MICFQASLIEATHPPRESERPPARGPAGSPGAWQLIFFDRREVQAQGTGCARSGPGEPNAQEAGTAHRTSLR